MRTRRHHNNEGCSLIRRGLTQKQVEEISKKVFKEQKKMLKGMASAKYDEEISNDRKFKHNKNEKIYSGKDVVYLDIDTMGPCFSGYITKELWNKTHNCDIYNKEYLIEVKDKKQYEY